MNKKIKMSPPWVVYYRKIEALFCKDSEIKMRFDEDTDTIKIYVNNPEKAEAIEKLLPEQKIFGNVIVKIQVIPANKLNNSRFSLFQKAFDGNPIVSFFETVRMQTNNMNFMVFKPEVVQYFNDDIGDIHGLCSTLYQDIAKDIFGNEKGIYFCTDVKQEN